MAAGKDFSSDKSPPTVDRLRNDIDSGKTDDKVPYPDPAAAPLGSDDEAAGTPPTKQQRMQEAASRRQDGSSRREEPEMLLLYGILAVGAALAIIGTALLLW